MPSVHSLRAIGFWTVCAAFTGFLFALFLDASLFGSFDLPSAVRWAGIAAIIGAVWGVVVQQLHEEER